MFLRMIRVTSVVLLLCVASSLGNTASAVTPLEYCENHNSAMAGGTCDVCGDACIKITGNLGDTIYKKCSEVECTQTNTCTDDCPECACD